MRHLIILLICLTLTSCRDSEQTADTQNDRFELLPEPDKDLREEYEAQLNDTLSSDTPHEEFLAEQLQLIRGNFRRINAITAWTSIEERELHQSAEGGVATYYFLKDALLKIVVAHFGETGKSIEEYYLKDGLLSFVFEQRYLYNRPISWDSTAMKENNDTAVFDIDKSEIIEDRTYFANGRLIQQINSQDNGSSITEKYLQEEQVRLQSTFQDLKEQLEE